METAGFGGNGAPALAGIIWRGLQSAAGWKPANIYAGRMPALIFICTISVQGKYVTITTDAPQARSHIKNHRIFHTRVWHDGWGRLVDPDR